MAHTDTALLSGARLTGRPFAAFLALVLALVLRLAIPAGWMPIVETDGAILLAPCPGAEPARGHADGGHHEGRHGGQDKDRPKSADCSFAPFQASFDLGGTPDVALDKPLAENVLPGFSPVSGRSPTGPPSPPPPSTGPPRAA